MFQNTSDCPFSRLIYSFETKMATLRNDEFVFLSMWAVGVFVSSDRSSCSDDGLLYNIYPRQQQRPLFQIFTHSLDAIDVTSVTLSCLNSINSFDVTRCKLKLIECRMFQCSNVPMIQCSNVQMIQCSNVFFFSWGRKSLLSIGPLVH